MARQIFTFLFCLFCVESVFAGPCDEYKKNPPVNIEKSSWNITVQSSQEDLWPKGGFVKIHPFYTLSPTIQYTYNGDFYCVYLESVNAVVGFQDFDITINKKHKSGSCEYDAILKHENHHIQDSVNALNSLFPDIKSTLAELSNSIETIYVEDPDNVQIAIEGIESQLIESEQIKRLIENFKRQQEYDANVLDSEPDEGLKQCAIEKTSKKSQTRRVKKRQK